MPIAAPTCFKINGPGNSHASSPVKTATRDKNHLVVSVVFPPAAGATGGVVLVVSVVLPSLVCEVVVSVLFSVVPFRLSQPIVNPPSAAIIRCVPRAAGRPESPQSIPSRRLGHKGDSARSGELTIKPN
jgi:hypothetical protein